MFKFLCDNQFVSASIVFQQSCFMECWKGSGMMTKACLAGTSTDNFHEPNEKKIKQADSAILTILSVSGSLLTITFASCIFHCCPCNVCKCCQPKFKKYTNLEKTDVDEIELVDIENDI